MNVHINALMCKGCEYCVKYCPTKILEMGTERNKKGHFFVKVTDEEKCTVCAICALMCPEAAIEITKEDSHG